MPDVLKNARAACLGGLSILLLGLLVACGGGGGGGSSSGTGTTGAATNTAPATSTLVLSLPSHGLTAQDLAVVVLQGDATSEAMASYYQSKRGVPAANMIYVSLPGSGGDTIAASDFATLKAQIDAQMPASAQAVLLAWSAPSRVVGASCSMSITSATTFGYSAAYCGGCATTAASAYYDSESTRPFAELGIRPTMLLGTSTLAAAQALIDRGVASDASAPGGTGWLVRTSDAARNVRYTDWTGLPSTWAGLLALDDVDNSAGGASDTVANQSNVMFYFTGLAAISNLASNTYRPGAVGDSLTSYAGLLPDGSGQTTVQAWLAAGLTASYGTVEEPCNSTAKFPRVSVLLDHYWRGDTLIEAYWKSVLEPGQGLFVGEPLAHPWPDAPSFAISGSAYQIATRALRPGSAYELDYTSNGGGSWNRLAGFTGARGGVANLSAPLAPATATQLRWTGPCASNTSQSCTLATSP
ncbi:MAG: TIGR03790 family protein [Pelomonas sp.]|nr:TIGR03790 family protein [Roseateles sp.]